MVKSARVVILVTARAILFLFGFLGDAYLAYDYFSGNVSGSEPVSLANLVIFIYHVAGKTAPVGIRMEFFTITFLLFFMMIIVSFTMGDGNAKAH